MSKTIPLNRVRPVPEGEHVASRSYLELSVVYDSATGDSYTSRKPVPANTLLTNTTYWVKTSNFNSQLLTKGNHYGTVADMKADSSLNVGMTCFTQGYYSANDGGGAMYEIVEGVHLDNAITQQIATSTRYAKLIGSGTINLLQMGCKGDGATDNTINIQLALDNFTQVLVPWSQLAYMTGKLVFNKNGQSLKGVTSQGIFWNGDDPYGNTLQATQNMSSGYIITIPYTSVGCVIENICLRGNTANSNTISGIELGKYDVAPTTSAGRHKLLHVYIHRMTGTGLKCNYRTWDCQLDDVDISYVGEVGVDWSGTDSCLNFVYVRETGSHGIIIARGANTLVNIKSFCNGNTNAESYALIISGHQTRATNIHVQQNYRNGMLVSGNNNIFKAVTIDGNGYNVPSNTYSSLSVSGVKNRIDGIIAGEWLGGTTKYGISITKSAYGNNYIDMTIDENERNTYTAYEDYPSMENVNVPYDNANNRVYVNGENICPTKTWLNMKDLIITNSGGLTHVVNGDGTITVTPSVTGGSISFRWTVATEYSDTTPVLVTHGKIKGLRSYRANSHINVSHDGTETVYTPYVHCDNVATGRLTDTYNCANFADDDILKANITWLVYIIDFSTTGVVDVGTTITLDTLQYYWTANNVDYVAPYLPT